MPDHVLYHDVLVMTPVRHNHNDVVGNGDQVHIAAGRLSAPACASRLSGSHLNLQHLPHPALALCRGLACGGVLRSLLFRAALSGVIFRSSPVRIRLAGFASVAVLLIGPAFGAIRAGLVTGRSLGRSAGWSHLFSWSHFSARGRFTGAGPDISADSAAGRRTFARRARAW